jgi:hypothetical protein
VCGVPRGVHGCNVIACKAPGTFVPRLKPLAAEMEILIRSIGAARTVGEVRALRAAGDKMIARLDEARRPVGRRNP